MKIVELREVAASLAGRPVDVQKLKTGQYVVEWFSFNTLPPPPGKTEEEALENFISFMDKNIKENTDAVDTDTTGDVG